MKYNYILFSFFIRYGGLDCQLAEDCRLPLLDAPDGGDEEEDRHVEQDDEEVEQLVGAASDAYAVGDFCRKVWKDDEKRSDDELRHEEEAPERVPPYDKQHHRER